MQLHELIDRTAPALLVLARLALAVALLWQAARLAFRPDPQDDLRRIDGLFPTARYHEALAPLA